MIYKRYLCLSFNFVMVVDSIPEAAIKKIQGMSLRKIKHWLSLPRRFITSALFLELVKKARSSTSSISSKSLSTYGRRDLREQSINRHDTKLKTLKVQRKALEIAELESSNRVWKRILSGLSAGQLSFLLRAGTDTLPTPLNLNCWRYRTPSSCPLCGHKQPPVHHILSNCRTALEQGRYTWRNNSALKSLVEGLHDHLEDNFTLYADLPNMRASDNPLATIPEVF